MAEKICIIILLNLVFYFKTLRFDYSSDDIPSARRKETHKPLKRWLLVLEGHLKSHPSIDHAITTILHAIVCVFIYLAFGTNNISFLAALLFSVNPINDQGAVWISGRGYVLSALGMTGALAFKYLSPLFLLLSAYSNAGFLAPIALLGSNNPLIVGFMPFIWVFYAKRFKNNVGVKIKQEMYTKDRAINIDKFVIAIKTLAFYTIHAIIPFKTTFYHSYMQSLAGSGYKKAISLKDPLLYAGLIMIGAIGYKFIFTPWDMVSFGLLWWLVCLAPFLNFLRMQQEIAQRYCYLPNVGLMVVLAYALIDYPIAQAVFITMYATKMWFWMNAYKDDYYLIEHSCFASPNAWFAWHMRAMKRWDTQSHQEALIMWVMAKNISPFEFKILFNIATTLKLSRHIKEAEQFIEQAEKNVPQGQEEQAKKVIEDWKKGQVTIII